MATKKDEYTRVRETLASFAGTVLQEEDILFQGTRLVIPKGMTIQRAVDTLVEFQEAEQRVMTFTRTFRYRPWDGAVATFNVLKQLAGIVNRATSMFSRATTIDIPNGHNSTIAVPWGSFKFDAIDAIVSCQQTTDEEFGTLFELSIDAPRKFRNEVSGLLLAVESELAENSIYRGKALDGSVMPNFINVEDVNLDSLVFNHITESQIRTNLWTLLDNTPEMRNLGVSLKRALLFIGDYGTGKTITGLATARIATDNQWTFIKARPGKDNLIEVMQTARLYQPAVVFYEDVDQLTNETTGDTPLSEVLDAFDGIEAKDAELIVVLTTNHPERIRKAMMRPGRLDSIIEFGVYDEDAILRFLEVYLDTASYEAITTVEAKATVVESLLGFVPAFIAETVDRAKRYALEARGVGAFLSLDEMVVASMEMRTHLKFMEDSADRDIPDPLTEQFKTVFGSQVEQVLSETVVRSEYNDEDMAVKVKANGK